MPQRICDVILWGTSSDREKVPATTLLAELPNAPGPKRERMILDFVRRGDVPDFVQVWCPVSVQHGAIKGEFYCTPDYLAIGSDEDFVRVRVNGVTAERIAAQAIAVLPTRKMVNDIYRNAACKLVAQTWGEPYDHTMMQTARWPVQDQKIFEQALSAKFERGQLWAGHAKDVVVGGGLTAHKGTTIGIYGWFNSAGKPIQGPQVNWDAHEWTYTDYSQCIRLVHSLMMVAGRVLPVQSVLKSPELAPLISDEGALEHVTYSEFHPEYLK
jgi:hypothetical protein